MIAGVDYTGVSVGFICHDGQGNILFHKRSQNCRDEQGKWDWGGGKLEFGETIEQALVREVKEEYGCDIISVDRILNPKIWTNQTGQVKTHWVILLYIVRVDRESAKNNEPRSIDEIGWFKIDSLPQPLHRGVAEEVHIYSQEIRETITNNI